MSEDFDREAERRKLEEKYGDEQDDRERTQQLSELLLKGATMTDIHCPECGDPIFRHEGRQFCPSCQREVATDESQQATAGQAAAENPLDEAAGAGDAAGADDSDAAESSGDGHAVEVETPDSPDEADESALSGAASAESAESSTSPETPAASPATSGPSQPSPSPQDAPQSPEANQSVARPTSAQSGAQSGTQATQPTDAETASGLMPARQHLTRTVNRLAEQAAAEEDPGRKREFLAATREAAEALEAVREAE
ncbi:MAG: Sjogren's syndrome/scleroderma autoantigen 1 family protein [Haloglomus sp.]